MAEPKKHIYFASDFHLGLHPADKSRKREKLIVVWLESIRENCEALYLLGDIFDFWWEYKKVVPRGFVRLLGKLAEFTDAGIPVHFFKGNHDMWTWDYLEKEIGINVHDKYLETTLYNKNFFIAHGDGLGKGDWGYKLLQGIFRNRILQWFYSRLHPNLGLGIGHAWAKKSRYSKGFGETFHGEDKEILIRFAKETLQEKPLIDYFVFGHRHIPLELRLNEKSYYYNLGEWITSFTYARFDGENMHLEHFDHDHALKHDVADK